MTSTETRTNTWKTQSPPFSIEAVQQAVGEGNKLAGKYGDVRIEARHVPEIHTRPLASQAHNARTLLGKHPELGEEISALREIGAIPHYSGPSAEGCRTSGVPYGDSETSVTAHGIWKDAQKGAGLSDARDCSGSGYSIACDAVYYGHRKITG